MSVDAFESVLQKRKPEALAADFKDKCKRLSFDVGAVTEKVSYPQPCGGACPSQDADCQLAAAFARERGQSVV
jgi:hypothetical protein